MECAFLPVVHVRELPEFMHLMAQDLIEWPRCACFGMVGCPVSVLLVSVPWAASLGQLADRSLEQVLVAYPVDYSDLWAAPDFWEGCRTGGFESAGAGVYLLAPDLVMHGAVWEEEEGYDDVRLDRCRASMPVPGLLQTAQRAEFWVRFWLQRSSGRGIWASIT